ncbi:hypothetical protein EON64_18830, partial [archaeon]
EEEARQAAEKARLEEEEARQAAEKARLEEEEARQAAEKARLEEEALLEDGMVAATNSELDGSVGNKDLKLSEEGQGEFVYEAIDVEPTPWLVLKTKMTDGKKVFVNVLHNSALPNTDDEAVWASEAFQVYAKQCFVAFSVNRVKYVMALGEPRNAADKEGGSSYVVDACVHTTVFAVCAQDEVLCDKLFVKILKAVSRKLSAELDAEYKMPKIARNYKGSEVLRVRVARFTHTSQGNSASSATGMTATPAAPSSPKRLAESTDSSLRLTEVETEKGPGRQSSSSLSPSPLPSILKRQASTEVSAPKQRTSYAINADWNRRWQAFLQPGYNVVFTSNTVKRNRLGMKAYRQLILTDLPCLLYVDVSKMQLKGTIAWTKTDPPRAATVCCMFCSSDFGLRFNESRISVLLFPTSVYLLFTHLYL